MRTFALWLLACASAADPAPAPTPAPASPAPPAPAPAPVVASPLRWEVVAVPTRLTMAERGAFRLRRQVTNTSDAPADAMAVTASFTVNGAPAVGLDLSFGNGVREARWAALPPGERASDERAVGDLFEGPGEYVIAMTAGGATSSVTVQVAP